MKRLLIHVEGQTEETFVNAIIAPHLLSPQIEIAANARLLGNQRRRSARGGIRSWESVRNELVEKIKNDPELFHATFFDYYGLPSDWPGRQGAAGQPVAEKLRRVQSAMSADVVAQMDRNFDRRRFLPFVTMHEFEGLLFSDCARFAEGLPQPNLAAQLQAIRDAFASPEEINDSEQTSPSHRLKPLCPGYQKVAQGVPAAKRITLQVIREQCPCFAAWIEQLESISQAR